MLDSADSDQDRPCWTYVSEEAGIDCTDMTLSEFLAFVETDMCPFGEQEKVELLEQARFEHEQIKQGFPNRYYYLYQ